MTVLCSELVAAVSWLFQGDALAFQMSSAAAWCSLSSTSCKQPNLQYGKSIAIWESLSRHLKKQSKLAMVPFMVRKGREAEVLGVPWGISCLLLMNLHGNHWEHH